MQRPQCTCFVLIRKNFLTCWENSAIQKRSFYVLKPKEWLNCRIIFNLLGINTQFEISEATRVSISHWIAHLLMRGHDYLWRTRSPPTVDFLTSENKCFAQ